MATVIIAVVLELPSSIGVL